ncbi:Zn-dependent alcohol dehydrogenase [Mesorhizobium sp. J18]|uniref:Zn-dependent alcohol dehydrogenase n=1 Tax=Mesorhizobium sp. J18 TaxID=935263 RepID=UPI00119AF302|nr:Zn-dependent alcohol dehydrogenase [Mesorhizobium sp. J18]TWG96870.1 Zn-dependent alcohol dehydrogenase [Mesorhizobium sp. J18]
MTTTIKAAICREFGKPLIIENIRIAPPGPGEVMVDIKACAICHSDISYAEGAWGGDLPAVYGHEAAGVVSQVGTGVTDFKNGDHVVVTLIRSCGGCHYCMQGSRVMCEEVFPLDQKSPLSDATGEAYVQAMRTGAFAEKVVVHESQLVAIPGDMPFAEASLLACGVITGFGAVVNTARVKPGHHVAVVGCGGVGLNSIQGAAIAGAGTIVAIDLSDSKLEAARRFGATHTVNPAKSDAAAEIKAFTAGRGVDFVFVTVGAKPAFDRAFDYITKNGSVVVVGMPPTGVLAEYDPGTLAAWNQKILGSKMGEATIATDIPQLVEHYRAGRLKLDELITGRYPLGEINQAIAAVNDGKALRNVIVF